MMTALNTMDDIGSQARLVEEIYRESGPELLAWLKRRHPSPQTAEDLLQETFAMVMKHPERILQADSPRAYLFGVARNLSAEVYRSSQADGELKEEEDAMGRLQPIVNGQPLVDNKV